MGILNSGHNWETFHCISALGISVPSGDISSTITIAAAVITTRIQVFPYTCIVGILYDATLSTRICFSGLLFAFLLFCVFLFFI